eukprot:6214837-Pleurochrysis_carterae.AAC.12
MLTTRPVIVLWSRMSAIGMSSTVLYLARAMCALGPTAEPTMQPRENAVIAAANGLASTVVRNATAAAASRARTLSAGPPASRGMRRDTSDVLMR